MDAVIPSYNVGDIVRVVAEPNLHAYVGWEDDMDQYCGLETRIADRWASSTAPGGFCYDIDADDKKWPWSGDCFEADIPVEDVDPDAASLGIDELISALGGA